MADAKAGEVAVDQMIARCPLTSNGAYTSVGTYPASEFCSLTTAFGEAAGMAPDALQREFGHWMLRRFLSSFPVYFESKADAFSMLESIENEVHVEVRKLYSETELPTFETIRQGNDTLVMIYRSPRKLVAFCHGLIEACMKHYGEAADITCVDRSTPGIAVAEFTIRRRAA